MNNNTEINISDIIKKIAKSDEEIFLKVCKVDSIDEQKKTINAIPIDGSAEIKNVRLTAENDSKEFLLIPEKGSFVVVGFMSNSSASVVLFGKIDKIIVNSSSLKLSTSGDMEINSSGKVGIKAGGTGFQELINELCDIVDGLKGQAGPFPLVVLPDTKVKITILKQRISAFFK